MGHSLLMVAALITRVTFAAAFTMPGGYNNNIGPDQGLALLRTGTSLAWFIISDSIAMTSSTTAICIIFWGAIIAAREFYIYNFAIALLLTYIAIEATGIAFLTGVHAVISHLVFRIVVYIIRTGIPYQYLFVSFSAGENLFSALAEVYQLFAYRCCKLMTKFIK